MGGLLVGLIPALSGTVQTGLWEVLGYVFFFCCRFYEVE
jgi:hypothetical protein